ncbi:acyl-CoA dehydrogenase family protein [Mycobacterium sp. 050134]|uniref:acyl-CoA dehydrogenase family protein n=1 Tax=Mycobacterium sp. 050134 TaxID=3096111 RepID=UPI002EDA2968
MRTPIHAEDEALDESWTMISEAVSRIFEDIAQRRAHVAIEPELQPLGWHEIEAEYPIAACALLFDAQGGSLATTNCLARVMLAELAGLVDGAVDGLVLPEPSSGSAPASGESRIVGMVLGPPTGRLIVPVSGERDTVSIGVVDADLLHSERIDTFDPSVHWTRVQGPLDITLTEATAQWRRAVAAAQRALGTELLSLASSALDVATEQVSARTQFGVSIGSLQSPRHALAEAAAQIAGARALLDQSWRFGGQLSALAAKAAAGRAHRAVADVALQVCGAIGLTAEHRLHRYVSRGFQLDALCGDHDRLETEMAEYLFDVDAGDRALPNLISWT